MIGLGKLGLPVALAIEDSGHDVYGYDINPQVSQYLIDKQIPYREEGIQPLLDNNKIVVVNSIQSVVVNSEVVFLAIQTPHQPEYEGDDVLPDAREDFDYRYLEEALAEVAKACKELRETRIVAVISTCLPGTFHDKLKPLLNEFVKYVYTPQFIAMGTVINDYFNPEFNLIGVHDPDAAVTMAEFYSTINPAPALPTDVTTAEGIKVAYNTWITAKTVIANAWGEMCERVGMDFDAMQASWSISTKRLLSPRYMRAGMSDGGGCHPRDNIALSWLADQVGMSHNIWEDLMKARQDYEGWHASAAMDAAEKHGLPIVILGRAFKPETDIETGSAAMLLANVLRRQGTAFLHVNDLDPLTTPAVYFLATQNARYRDYAWPKGSVVLDPFGYIPDTEGVEVVRLGRR